MLFDNPFHTPYKEGHIQRFIAQHSLTHMTQACLSVTFYGRNDS